MHEHAGQAGTVSRFAVLVANSALLFLEACVLFMHLVCGHYAYMSIPVGIIFEIIFGTASQCVRLCAAVLLACSQANNGSRPNIATCPTRSPRLARRVLHRCFHLHRLALYCCVFRLPLQAKCAV